jgi:hypothetical protein
MAVSGVGFLATVSEKVREFISEPGPSSEFSDARILDMMRRAWADVMDDVNRVTSMGIRARIDLAVVADQREYALPPFTRILEIKKLTDDGDLEWEITPKHPLAPTGPNFTIEGPMLRFDPNWDYGYTLQLVYTPSAEVEAIEATEDELVKGTGTADADGTTAQFDLSDGTPDLSGITTATDWSIRVADQTGGIGGSDIFDITAVNDTTDIVTVATVPDAGTDKDWEIFMDTTHVRYDTAVAGTRDTRANAYAGHVLKVLSSTEGTKQDRVVTAYSNTLGEFTVAPAFSPSPGRRLDPSNLLTFEVVPAHAYRFQDLIALKAARFIAAVKGDRDRFELLQTEYADAIRALRLQHANAEQRIGPHMTRVTRYRRRWGKTV